MHLIAAGLCMHAAPAGSSSGDLGDVMVDSAEDRVRQSEQLLEEGMVLYRLTDIKVFWVGTRSCIAAFF